MKIGELKKILENLNDDVEVKVKNIEGFSFIINDVDIEKELKHSSGELEEVLVIQVID